MGPRVLTDLEVRRAAPRDKPYKLFDTGGLFLLVTAGGSRLWRMRYKLAGREKKLAFGCYPEVPLARAREARDAARAELRAGRDPAVLRAAIRAATVDQDRTFEAVAREWHARKAPGWVGRHAADVIESLERHAFPTIGRLPVGELTPPMVLGLLRTIEAAGSIETAHRVRQRLSAVFVDAIARGIGQTDPAATVKTALRAVPRGRQPAIVDLVAAREMLVAVEAIPAHPVTRLAHRFLALTAVRPGELHGAAWRELEGDTWTVPAERMKMKRPHVVPLSREALAVVEAVRPLSGRGPLLFPNARWAHRPMTENAVGYLLNRAGYAGQHVPHGWRATFSTVMNEAFPEDRAVIDLMLAHLPKDRVEAAYNRAVRLPRRRELAQLWADMLLVGMRPAREIIGGQMRS